MSDVLVTETNPTPGTLAQAAYEQPDYVDAFVLEVPAHMSLEDFAARFFLCQPQWIAKVSMNIGGDDDRADALGDRSFADGSAVGSWKIHGRDDREILFGEHMGFMEYRFSVLRRDDGNIEASTVVQYTTRLAPIYFTIVKPFHRAFTKRILRTVATELRVSQVAQ